MTTTTTHANWCTDDLGPICRGEKIQIGPADIRIVGALDWPGHDQDAIAIYASDNYPLTPAAARLLADRLVQLADQIDRNH